MITEPVTSTCEDDELLESHSARPHATVTSRVTAELDLSDPGERAQADVPSGYWRHIREMMAQAPAVVDVEIDDEPQIDAGAAAGYVEGER